MTQMLPVGNNPFSMFKMPESMVSDSAASNVSNTIVVPKAADDKSVDTLVKTQGGTDNNEKANRKKIVVYAAAAASIVAIGAGIIYAVKNRKIPFLNKGTPPSVKPATTSNIVEEGVQSVAEQLTNNLPVTPPVIKPAATSNIVEEGVQSVAEQLTNNLPVTPTVVKPAATSNIVEEGVQSVADVTAKSPKPKDNKFKDVGFVVIAFSAGLITKLFRNLSKSDSVQAEKLKNKVIENEAYIKDVELPFITQEANEYYSNYKEDVLCAIDTMCLRADDMKNEYNKAIAIYSKLDSGDYCEYWDDANTKKIQATRNENGVTKLELYSKDGNNKRVINYSSIGKPLSIERYKDGKLLLKCRYKTSAETNKPYLSQMLIYTKGSNKASLIAFDENGNPEFYLARNNDGKLIKAFDIDSDTLDVKTIMLPGDNGEDWLKKYNFESDGNLKSALIMPSNDMPLRRYNFDDGCAQSMDLYNDIEKKPILHVPFESKSQLELIEK